MEPHRELVELLDGVPGFDEMIAWTLIAEMGTDTSVFPTSGHVASWAGMCPGTNESAGRQMSTRTRKGNRYLRRGFFRGGRGGAAKKRRVPRGGLLTARHSQSRGVAHVG